MGKARRRFGFDNVKREREQRSQFRENNTRAAFFQTPSQRQATRYGVYDFLRVAGGFMHGPIGHAAQQHAPTSGVLDLRTNSVGDTVKIRKNIRLFPETGNSDTIDAIESGGDEFPFQEMRIIMSVIGNTITFTHSASVSGTERKISCPNATDFVLKDKAMIDMIFDTIDNSWHIVDNLVLNNFTATEDIKMDGNNIILDSDEDTHINNVTDDLVIFTAGGTEIFRYNASFFRLSKEANFQHIHPRSDNTYDNGESGNAWRDLYVDRTAFIDELDDNDNAGEIDVKATLHMDAGDIIDFSDTSSTAGAGSQTLPANPQGFIVCNVNGTSRRIPFYTV